MWVFVGTYRITRLYICMLFYYNGKLEFYTLNSFFVYKFKFSGYVLFKLNEPFQVLAVILITFMKLLHIFVINFINLHNNNNFK